MSAINFLILKLNELSKRFPQSNLRLGKSEDDSEYLVEISPSELLTSNSEFKQNVNQIFLNFLKIYPDDSLVFITEMNFLNLENPKFFWHDGSVNELNQWVFKFDIKLQSNYNLSSFREESQISERRALNFESHYAQPSYN